MKKETLWILSELFYPDDTSTSYIMTEVAKRMVDKYNVKIITCTKDELPKEKGYINNPLTGVEVYRVWIPKLNKNKSFQRIVKLLWASVGMFFKCLIKIRRKERILIVTNPAPFIIFMSFLRRLKSLHTILLVHDIFPENLIPTHLISTASDRRYRLLLYVFNKAYKSFDDFIVIGQDMKRKLDEKLLSSKSTKNHKITIIENWAEVDRVNSNCLLESDIKRSSFILNYSGNIGRGQGLIEFLKIFAKSKNLFLSFHIYGSGAVEDEIREFIASHELAKRVKLLGPYSRSEQNEVLNDCDLALVSLAKGMSGLGVPSKTYNILAAGKPILYLGDTNSEIDILVRNEKVGVSFEQSQEESIIQFLDSLDFNSLAKFQEMGKKARFLAETNYSKKDILERFYNTI